MKIDKIKKSMERAKKEYDFYRSAVELHDRYEASGIGEWPESVFRAYLIKGTTTDAAKMLNDAGQRIAGATGDKMIQGTDVSRIIDNTTIADENLMNIARALLDSGRKASNYFH